MSSTTFTVPNDALKWLREGERGSSSEFIVQHLTGIPLLQTPLRSCSYPSDVSDLRRCLQLFAAVPDFKARLGELATASRHWAKLVAHWERLTALYAEETAYQPGVAPTGACPKTYALMKLIERTP